MEFHSMKNESYVQRFLYYFPFYHYSIMYTCRIGRSRVISFPVRMKLFKALVASILLYGCEGWTLTADLERRFQAFEYKCYRRLLRISYREHKTNDYVRPMVSTLASRQEPLLGVVQRCKLAWYGHVTN